MGNLYLKQGIEYLNNIRAKIYYNTISNDDVKLIDENIEKIPKEKAYLVKIAIYEKLNQKRNALLIIQEIENNGIQIKGIKKIKDRMKSKKSKFDLSNWDEIIGWDVTIKQDASCQVYEKEQKEDIHNIKEKKEEKETKGKDVSSNIKDKIKKEKKYIISSKICQEAKETKRKINKPKVEKEEKVKKIQNTLSTEVSKRIAEIKNKYYAKMQNPETQVAYIKKYDRLQAVLESDIENKRMQMELMLILINEGYRQTVKQEFPNEDYNFIDGIIKEFYQEKVTAINAQRMIDEYSK